MKVEFESSVYLGTSKDESIGKGFIIRGKAIRLLKDGTKQMQCLDDEWINVYDVVRIKTGSSNSITWIE